MTIVDRITEHLRNPPLNEDGEPFGTTLLPPLSAEEISALERIFGCAIGSETRALLSHCGGFREGVMEIVDFKGEEARYVRKALQGRFREISPDGYGNFWFYWTSATNSNLGPIYYYQHEGPMLFYQSDSLIDFVGEYLRFMTPPYDSQINDVHEFKLKPLGQLNLDLIERTVALASEDSEMRTFAESVPENSLLYDFRGAKIGDGIDLEKLELISIHSKLPLLAVKPRKGLMAKISSLFSRDK